MPFLMLMLLMMLWVPPSSSMLYCQVLGVDECDVWCQTSCFKHHRIASEALPGDPFYPIVSQSALFNLSALLVQADLASCLPWVL
jgi:hypothetical protein